MKDVYIDEKNFYRKIKRYVNKRNSKVHFLYNHYDIVDDSFLKSTMDEEIKTKIKIIHAINLKKKEERYSYLYDQVCDFLDEEFKKKNICRFKDNICIGVKKKCHCQSVYGCCYGSKRGLCKNLVHNECQIKSISCKLFVCNYLKKEGFGYKVDDIALLKYFFNKIQKYYIEYSLFKDKDEMIPLLLKYTRK